MTISVKKIKEYDLTLFSVHGEVAFKEQMAVLKNFYERDVTKNVIWDFRNMEGSRLNASELREINLYLKRNADKRVGGKTALVSSKDVDFGLSRISSAIADLAELPFGIRPFKNYDDALQWIMENDKGVVEKQGLEDKERH